jgi:hypothetical protein
MTMAEATTNIQIFSLPETIAVQLVFMSLIILEINFSFFFK